MVIDFHTHNFPDSIAARAMASMVEKLQRKFLPVADGTLRAQLEDAGRHGIDRCVMCPIATKPQQAASSARRAT